MAGTAQTNAQLAVRAGWLMAELRGRLDPTVPEPPAPAVDRRQHLLPLPSERSADERQVEVRKVLGTISATFGVAPAPPATGTAPPFAAQLEQPAITLTKLRRTPAKPSTQEAWNAVGEVLYQWDAAFQDTLAGKGVLLPRAYELGRSVAEIYWAANPDVVPDGPGPLPSNCWEHLLGEERVGVIDALLRTVGPQYHPTTAPAVSAAVHAWAVLVRYGELRRRCGAPADIRAALEGQARWWHELLVVAVDPETLLEPYAGQPSRRISWKALRRFGPEAAWATGGFLGLVGLAFATVELPSWGWLKPLLASLGVLGISVGTVQGALKNAAQSMFGRIEADLYADLVITAVTVLPPAATTTKTLKGAVAAAMDARTVTSPLSSR